MFCYDGAAHGCTVGSFDPAAVPVYGEYNVGFSQTYANVLLPTLPANSGIILINTGVGGTGFHYNNWNVPNGTSNPRLPASTIPPISILI